MTDLQEKAMRMALEFIVLSSSKDRAWFTKKEFEVVAALRQALAQEQEPYDQTALELCEKCGWKAIIPDEGCFVCARNEQEFVKYKDDEIVDGVVIKSVYTEPPKREWVELTNEDIHTTEGYEEDRKMFRFAKALLAKAKGKNT